MSSLHCIKAERSSEVQPKGHTLHKIHFGAFLRPPWVDKITRKKIAAIEKGRRSRNIKNLLCFVQPGRLIIGVVLSGEAICRTWYLLCWLRTFLLRHIISLRVLRGWLDWSRWALARSKSSRANKDVKNKLYNPFFDWSFIATSQFQHTMGAELHIVNES